MVRLGELSFAFYMVHILVTRVAEFVLPHRPQLPPLPALGASAAVFAASLAAAWMLYEWVERPGRNLITSLARHPARTGDKTPRAAVPHQPGDAPEAGAEAGTGRRLQLTS
jgi:peptidoglycan/LPS O-acetylase OafA/YrhL